MCPRLGAKGLSGKLPFRYVQRVSKGVRPTVIAKKRCMSREKRSALSCERRQRAFEMLLVYQDMVLGIAADRQDRYAGFGERAAGDGQEAHQIVGQVELEANHTERRLDARM